MVGYVLLIPLKHVINVENEREVFNIAVKMKTEEEIIKKGCDINDFITTTNCDEYVEYYKGWLDCMEWVIGVKEEFYFPTASYTNYMTCSYAISCSYILLSGSYMSPTSLLTLTWSSSSLSPNSTTFI